MNKHLLRTLIISSIFLAGTVRSSAQSNINISEFTVSVKAQKIAIDWKTDGSTATNYFAIQKSTDGINYKTVALVLGPDPKKNNESYGCFDKGKTSGHPYYRLIHIDTNGNEQITEAKQLARS
jgi:hypothetical protein